MARVSFVAGSEREDQRQERHQDDQYQPGQGVEATGAHNGWAAHVYGWIVLQVLIDAAFGFLLVVCQVFAQQIDGGLALIGMQQLAYGRGGGSSIMRPILLIR